jgi:hypothetical protein
VCFQPSKPRGHPPATCHLAPGTCHLPPATCFLAPGIWHLAPGTWHLAPGVGQCYSICQGRVSIEVLSGTDFPSQNKGISSSTKYKNISVQRPLALSHQHQSQERCRVYYPYVHWYSEFRKALCENTHGKERAMNPHEPGPLTPHPSPLTPHS